MVKAKRFFIDTNVFLRSVLDDNLLQAKEARLLFESSVLNKIELKTSVVVIFEAAWVLKSYYNVTKEALRKVLLDILELKVSFFGKKIFKLAVRDMDKFEYDLEDAFNFYTAKELEVDEFVTFDKKLQKKW